ncbi:MAG TPA: inositol monophosphatase family protein [Bryobacteraceae bacterium]|nr:inositol monophosphatase family protein [Bryobacteraceae bacterium]HOQ45524.1 inositol monophosphatase family protein [Bryobacteraceae bacterium]HPQ16171.1 inositol monophosphatase family protein [Bryobacteraceae bacterium]HPU73438.1 inositol monophosphatase family protein [Bryobacteraceae bacterium]
MASYLETAMEIAREAGALLANYFERRIGYQLKGEYDLVTEADRASEKLVVERLHSHFPSHSVVAEEGTGQQRCSEFCWYVDPLDGTTNFAHGFPAFNVTLALEQAGELVAGCIFDPIRQEMFAAERGSGAYLNHRRIRVSKVDKLEETLVATGFPSRKRHANLNIHFYYQMAMFTHGVRRAGSAALDLAYVACGRLDAFWEFNLNPWDVAAGILLIREAGGTVTDMRGGPAKLRGEHILADNGLVHGSILELFDEVFAGKARVPLPEIGVPR